ncbi:MAG: threonylcarbamoyl-AMP synthase [Clostridia bacterium]|nr:threonylcarbamoyl-AMP synthase [Clostridia bacterium]
MILKTQTKKNTRFITLGDLSAPETIDTLREAGECLRSGGTVVFPTETVYGLGGNALDSEAASRIYAAKGRPADNPLIVHIADPEEATEFTQTPPLYLRLARAFMPGPLTVIMPAKDTVPLTVRAGLPTVAVRCPAHPAAQALLRAAGVPIAAPSANLSGSPSPTCAEHVRDDMDGRVDMILDGGDCEFGVESTIVKIEEEDHVTLLRPGAVTKDDIEALGVSVTVAPAVFGQLKEGEAVLSPGMKYRHYAPKAPLYLLDGDEEKRRNFLLKQTKSVAYFAYEEETHDAFPENVSLYVWGKKSDTQAQAQALFRLLREADKLHYDAIYAPLPQKEGLAMALYNRMIRAAAHQILPLA